MPATTAVYPVFAEAPSEAEGGVERSPTYLRAVQSALRATRSPLLLQLPTDEEYLDQLHERFKDDEWIAAQERYSRPEDIVAAVEKYISEGSFKDAQRSDVVEAVQEATTPSLYFRGKFVNFLRTIALKAAEKYVDILKDIPVGCLPTRTLNAGAYRTPRGGAVILLDQGVIFHLGMLVRCYVAFRTWRTPDPYCRDHPQGAFAETILRLAQFCTSGDVAYLRKIETWNCPSLPAHDELVEAVATSIEIFIMLHEFGHVELGHLAGGCALSLTLEPAGELTLYTNSEQQEFEADQFAFSRYCEIRDRPDDVAFGCGLLFHFFNLCEIISPPKIRTHPPALSRWHRIREAANLSKYPQSWANYLDEEFAIISRGLAQA
jgi:hypothetical protein